MAKEALTQKQEAFARAFFECGNAAEAYRQAYDVEPNARDGWLYVEACQLLDNPKVALRLKSLREQAERISIYNRQKALEEYEEARKLALDIENPSAAVAAVNGKVKLLGLEAPAKAKMDLSSSDGTMTPKPGLDMSKLSDAALAEIVAARDAAQGD